ncbi:MAG TPA: POTRA domain-containing protein, partial [Ignavibacteriaceae bacterium]
MFQTSIFFFSLLLLLSFTVYSQVKSYKVLGISVQGNESTDAGTIIASSGIKVGDEIQIPGDKTLNAIRNLYALGAFSDIQILLDKEVGDGAFFIIKVEEYQRVERTVIEGNDEIDTDEIEDKISFVRGTTLKPNEVANLKQRILALYEEEGFLNAEINEKYYDFYRADTTEDGIEITWRNQKDLSDEHVVLYEDDDIIYTNLIDRIKDRVLLKLEIEENDEVVVREIEFYGNDAFDDDDLYGEMDEISTATWWKFWSSDNFNKEGFKKDKQLIKDFYLKNGYRDADIISDSLIYFNDNKDLRIVIEVYEGPQYKIRNIAWEGNTIYPDEVLTERLDFAKGDIFDYEKFQRNLFGNEQQSDVNALYQDNGYLTFRLTPSEIKAAPDSIDVIIRLEERNQFKIGHVKVEGNTKTKDNVVRRELYTIPGDYFNRGLLFRSIQQLANLQYFNVEKLYGPQGLDYSLPNDSTVDITFRVEEKSSDYLNASVGYSGSFGFSGAVGVTLTNFSIAEPFSLGGGQ